MKLVYKYEFLEKIWIMAYSRAEFYNKAYNKTGKKLYLIKHKFWIFWAEKVWKQQVKCIHKRIKKSK